ncbi:LysR family transcriptional regulator [Alicycliphilus sp. B1]|nr:LysR family transcriptional regulator [Alicycliphilus sp. B1]
MSKGMRNLDIGLLRTFVAVAERESFTNAAEKVYRTQAAVSQQMQKLESVLGCALFERVGRRKKLTVEGVRLLEYARRMVGLNDEAYRVITQQAATQPGEDRRLRRRRGHPAARLPGDLRLRTSPT